MMLAPDKSELAQRIADALQEGIDAGPHVFYGSTYYRKSDYCKNLIKPLIEKYNIEILLESLPPHVADSLRETYSRLMSCFNQTGELLNHNMSLNTVVRHVNDLIKELRNLAQGAKQNTTAAKQKAVKPSPQRKHSDEELQQALASFEKFNDECNDAKQAWNEVAEHHGFKSWTAVISDNHSYRSATNRITGSV